MMSNFLSNAKLSSGAAGPSQATQAALEAETDEDTYAPPDLIKHGPGVAKAWLQWEQIGTHSILASYNITSITDGGVAGDTDITIATDFSGVDYAIVGSVGRGGTGTDAAMISPSVNAPAAGTLTMKATDDTGASTDYPLANVALFGDQ